MGYCSSILAGQIQPDRMIVFPSLFGSKSAEICIIVFDESHVSDKFDQTIFPSESVNPKEDVFPGIRL